MLGVFGGKGKCFGVKGSVCADMGDLWESRCWWWRWGDEVGGVQCGVGGVGYNVGVAGCMVGVPGATAGDSGWRVGVDGCRVGVDGCRVGVEGFPAWTGFVVLEV